MWPGCPQGHFTHFVCHFLVFRKSLFGVAIVSWTIYQNTCTFYIAPGHLSSKKLKLEYLGLNSLKKKHRLTGIWIPVINLRRSDDRLRFIVWIPIAISRCPESKVHGAIMGPRWVPCWPHEPCYQGDFLLNKGPGYLFIDAVTITTTLPMPFTVMM